MSEAEEFRARHERAERLVQLEVMCCMTSLVEEFARTNEEAQEIVLEALSAGASCRWECADSDCMWVSDDPSVSEPDECPKCSGADFHQHDDPEYPDVYEWWAISSFLARDLNRHGEIVLEDFWGLTLWGRQCTGQAIALDHVIQEISEALHNPQRDGETCATT